MTERDIFLAVLDLPDAAARAAFLKTACGDDVARRARVEALLRSHDNAGSFLAEPAVAPPQPDHAATEAFSATPDADANQTTGGTTGDDDEALSFLAPPRRPDSLGRIGHYEVLEVLGRGGFGIVFRAFDDVLQRVVAVKVLAPGMAATSPARKRFLREARSSAQIRHENVVQVYAVEEQPLPYLVMEFIPGETLQDRLNRTGPLDVPEVLRIGRQVAEGLAAAHAQGLIHRDVKPANVLIEGGPQHRVKLTDFGLARAADDASISQSGVVAGTPMYMAPEQAKGETLDHRADLFSLGSVLYVMCSGRPPFRASGTLAVLKRVCEEDPRPIREVIPEVPEWLCRVIAKLHAKSPDDRFQTARDVADILADCEAQVRTHGAVKDFSRIPGGLPARRRGSWKGVAAALLAIFVALGLFGVLRPRPDPGQGPDQPRAIPAAWGEVVDPLGDCNVSEAEGRLTIVVPPGGGHNLNPTPGWRNLAAPRVLQPADGDFEARVTVLPFQRPTKDNPTGGSSYNGAGLVVVADDARLARLFVARKKDYRSGFPYAHAEWFTGGDGHGQQTKDLREGPIHLRVRREGGALFFATSTDGQSWDDVKTLNDLEMGAHVQVGVAAVTSADEEFTAAFEGLVVEPRPAAGKPPPSFAPGQEVAGWGTPVDPSGDCRFAAGNDGLTITVPAGHHNLNPTAPTLNTAGPRVLKKARGDFDIQVKVLRFERPKPGGAGNGVNHNFVAAGLLAWSDGDNFVRLLRGANGETGRLSTTLEVYREGKQVMSKGVTVPDRPTYLRIERHIGRLRCLYSTDGAKWTAIPIAEPLWDGELDVGVAAVNTTTAVHVARFDMFQFKDLSVAQSPPLAVAPFDATKAKEYQEAWAKHVGVPVELTNAIGMKLRLIPPGEFTMGSTTKELDDIFAKETLEDWEKTLFQDEVPAKSTTIRDPYYLGDYEVTVGQFRKFVDASKYVTEAEANGKGGSLWNPETKQTEQKPEYNWKNPRFAANDDVPVTFVTLEDARAFCRWLSDRDGRTYAIPDESHWEFACRAGTTTQWSFGDDKSQAWEFGWFDGVWPLHEVGGKKPNPFGLFDMHGNAREIAVTSNGSAVVRGGSRYLSPLHARSACRAPGTELPNVAYGFRVAIVDELKTRTPPLAVAPFDAAKAKEHQEAWAKHLGTNVVTTNSVGAKMVLIPPGEFLMGSTDEQVEAALKMAAETNADNVNKNKILNTERPRHRVEISRPFLMGATKVTIGQFKAFTAATGYQTKSEIAAKADGQGRTYQNPGFDVSDDFPATFIAWTDAMAFCKWLSEKEKAVYRLPTEAEWEYACRAGTTTQYSFGDDRLQLGQYAWFDENSDSKPHAVGTKLPNPFGLFDMHGNVYDWCKDFWAENSYDNSPANDPTGPAFGANRVMRGGCWIKPATSCRSAFRGENVASATFDVYGFRVIRVLDAPAATVAPKAAP